MDELNSALRNLNASIGSFIDRMTHHKTPQEVLRCYVDMSAILPDYVRTFGITKTNEMLRAFGVDRLLFATDYPDNRVLQPDGIYNSYFDILNQMDFTEEEAERIAYGNAKDLLG